MHEDVPLLEHLADKLFTDERCKIILADLLQESGLLRKKSNEQLRVMSIRLTQPRWPPFWEYVTLVVGLQG